MNDMSIQEKQKHNIDMQKKYRMAISSIQMLALRASSKDTHEKLKRLAKFLEEVREQSYLCLISEKDRIEKVRYKELLEYIDEVYDKSKESVIKICETLEKREDIDEVLKYHDKKKTHSREEER